MVIHRHGIHVLSGKSVSFQRYWINIFLGRLRGPLLVKRAYLAAAAGDEHALCSGVGHACHAELAGNQFLRQLLVILICSDRSDILQVGVLVGLLEFEIVSHKIGRLCAIALPGRKVVHYIILLS